MRVTLFSPSVHDGPKPFSLRPSVPEIQEKWSFKEPYLCNWTSRPLWEESLVAQHVILGRANFQLGATFHSRGMSRWTRCRGVDITSLVPDTYYLLCSTRVQRRRCRVIIITGSNKGSATMRSLSLYRLYSLSVSFLILNTSPWALVHLTSPLPLYLKHIRVTGLSHHYTIGLCTN